MANPQKEDGFTAIANEIVEHLWRVNLSSYESRVLWYLFRKTYGWQKKTDRIALSQFAKDIELDRRLIFRALKGLSSKEMIVIYKDDKNIIKYGFQKNYEKWRLSSKKMSIISRDDRLSSKEILPLSSIEIPTKEIIKETIQKKETLSNPQIKTFIDFYFQEFKNHFGTPPIIQGGKDGKIIQRLLKSIPLEDLKDLILIFFESNDKFIKQSGYTLGVFESQINKLRINTKQAGLKAWAKEIIQEEENGRER